MRGVVDYRRGRWRLDVNQNIGSLISNEIILAELQDFLERHFGRATANSVLDLGAGSKPYERLYDAYFSSSTAVDVPHSPHDTSSVDLFASADKLPFDDGSFDCVICTEVLEHCREPRSVMAEIARVLKRGGWAFLTTPFLLPLHEMPFDYYRYTPSALGDLGETAGLSVASIQPRGSYAAVAMTLIQMPIAKIWQRLTRITGLPLYHRYNPAVYLLIVLPQRLYLLSRGHFLRRPVSRPARIYVKMTYYTLGYITELQKPK